MAKVSTTAISSENSQIVAQVIDDCVRYLSPFSVSQYRVEIRDILNVAKAVRDGRITVVNFKEENAKFAAGYVSKNSVKGFILLEKWKSGGNAAKYRSLIVHEAIHAAMDIKGEHSPFTISAINDESLAYIAQAMYLIGQGRDKSDLTDQNYCVKAGYYLVRKMIEIKQFAADSITPTFSQFQEIVKRYYGGEDARTKDGV
jgi:hypothetical protein